MVSLWLIRIFAPWAWTKSWHIEIAYPKSVLYCIIAHFCQIYDLSPHFLRNTHLYKAAGVSQLSARISCSESSNPCPRLARFAFQYDGHTETAVPRSELVAMEHLCQSQKHQDTEACKSGLARGQQEATHAYADLALRLKACWLSQDTRWV
jgi:hypothetical protein